MEATCSSETDYTALISQKMELFINTDVRTSNPTYFNLNFYITPWSLPVLEQLTESLIMKKFIVFYEI
jgi:hypothetical protein